MSPLNSDLARDPDALRSRTLTDKDIFYNSEAGLPRAERELAAAATARFNGCSYCASVHARFSATYSRREADVQLLLDDGINADLGEPWNAIVAASVALSTTPIAFGSQHVERLRSAGLDDLAIADVIHAPRPAGAREASFPVPRKKYLVARGQVLDHTAQRIAEPGLRMDAGGSRRGRS
jgi:uncharacterized peroxidase-related enzyme